MTTPPFIINEEGVYFTVLMFEDYVVKIPRPDRINDVKELKFIAESQDFLSENINGILPCWLIECCLIMPRAKGIRADKLSYDEKDHIQLLRNVILEQIEKLEYELIDCGSKNMFYDEGEDQVYLIDFHAIKKMNKEEIPRTKCNN